MSRCEYCKKTKTEWKELSFHRLPTDEKIKLQWVRNMGRINWMPKYYSSLCSEHFSKECIDFRDKLPRLRKGSIPTIFNHEKENISPPLQEFSELEHINHLNKRRKFEDENVSQEINNVRPSTDHLTNMQREIKENKTSINVNHDHIYVKSLDTMTKKLNAALLTIKKLRTKNKLLNKKERAKKKISNLKNIVQELRKTHHLSHDVMDEMGIKKGFQRSRDGKMRGYVDIGVGTEGTSNLHEVKNALVMLVVALNDTWKLPIAFFLINGLSAETEANLINDALMRLHEVGVKITSLMLDGPAEHFAAVKRLEARK